MKLAIATRNQESFDYAFRQYIILFFYSFSKPMQGESILTPKVLFYLLVVIVVWFLQ